MVDMAEITPVCVQNADGFIGSGIAAHFCDIFIAATDIVHPGVPAAHARTQILGCSHTVENLCLPVGLVGGIAPCETDNLLRQLLVQFRMAADNVSPEHGRLASGNEELEELADVIQIQLARALLLGKLHASSLAQIEGLVRADIELVRAEKLHVLLYEGLHQLYCRRIGHVHRMVVHPIPEGKQLRALRAARQLAQLLMAPGSQKLVKMTE